MFRRRLLLEPSSRQEILFMTRRCMQKDVAIVGYPYGGGQERQEMEDTPKNFRTLGLIQQIEEMGRNVYDYGDIHVPEYSCQFPSETYFEDGKYMVKNVRETGVATQQLAALVETACRDDKLVVTLGGDHTLATGSITGQLRARPDTCVLYIDALNDNNNHRTSPTGHLNDMCLTPILKGLTDLTFMPGLEWSEQILNPRDMVYVGLRDPDPADYKRTDELGIPWFSMHDVDHFGIKTVIERAIQTVNSKFNKPIHVTFDASVLSLKACPGISRPINGGFTLREVLYIGETINKTGLLAGLDFAEVNPYMCTSHRDWEVTMDTCFQIIKTFLGWHRPGFATNVSSKI